MDQKTDQLEVLLPRGKDPIDTVRIGMSMSGSSEDIARMLGISKGLFRLTRKLLMLKARDHVEVDDKVLIERALELINDGRLGEASELTLDVIRRNWTKRTLDGIPRERATRDQATLKKKRLERFEDKKRRRFENTMFAIREACCNNEELEVPGSLTEEESRNHLETVMQSIAALAVLFQRMKGEAK